MLLAWAMLSNTAFAAEIRKLPRLFALMDDQQLFARTRTTRDQDFFSLLLKFEQSTGMLTQFDYTPSASHDGDIVGGAGNDLRHEVIVVAPGIARFLAPKPAATLARAWRGRKCA
jgi:hypothetical protein